MPGYEISRLDVGDVDHGLLELQVRMQRRGQLLAVTRRSALEFARHVRAGEPPVVHGQVLICRGLADFLERLEERT